MSAQGKTRAVKSKPTPCPSTIPEAGLDLSHAVTAYREWLVEQALIRTNGNVSEAARLLNVKRTTLDQMRRRGSRVRLVPRLPSAMNGSAPEPVTGVHERERSASGNAGGVMRFSRSRAAELRGQGLSIPAIARELGCNRYMAEKLLSEPRPIAKCGARREAER